MTQPAPEIRDNPEEARYEALLDGELAGVLDYRDRGGRRILVHTVVDPGHEGRGVGSRLAAGALDDARNQGLKVVPRCPFVRAYLRRHPEYGDIVSTPPDGRPQDE